jgi:hypothetical protein
MRIDEEEDWRFPILGRQSGGVISETRLSDSV